MSKKYTKAELAELVDRKDWKTLWRIVVPMVKHEVRCCMQRGLDPFYVRDDLMQEAYLAAWQALPTWNAFESGLRKWVGVKVRSAVLNANATAASGMVGSRNTGTIVVSMHGETTEEDGSDDEQGGQRGPEARMVYEDTPEGFGNPDIDIDTGRLLSHVPKEDRDMVRRLCGLGVPAETQEEYAVAEHCAVITVKKRLQALRKYFYTFSPKLVKEAMTKQ